MRVKHVKYYSRCSDKNGMMEGYTDNYIKVTTPHRAEWANQIVEWKL